jgi:hypothetical protein
MQYIVYKRFKAMALCGEVNIPALSVCECEDGLISYNGNPICYNVSENAHQHFTRNNDGQGLLRGKLIQAITNTLTKRDADYQARWNKVWEDNLCQKYKRSDYSDYWLWNHDFFNAEIYDLKHIAGLVGAKI